MGSRAVQGAVASNAVGAFLVETDPGNGNGEREVTVLAAPGGGTLTPAQDSTLTNGSAKFQGVKGTKTLTTPATSTTPASVLAANSSRKLAVLTNPKTNTVTIYIGPSTMTTSAYTAALDPGASWVDSDSNDVWYAASAAGTPTLAVTEIA